VGGWHSDVDDGDIRAVLGNGIQERRRVVSSCDEIQ